MNIPNEDERRNQNEKKKEKDTESIPVGRTQKTEFWFHSSYLERSKTTAKKRGNKRES